jgi:hypothetical protein
MQFGFRIILIAFLCILSQYFWLIVLVLVDKSDKDKFDSLVSKLSKYILSKSLVAVLST